MLVYLDLKVQLRHAIYFVLTGGGYPNQLSQPTVRMPGATHPGTQNPTSTYQQMPGTFQGQTTTQSMGPSNPMSTNPYGQGQMHPQIPRTMPNLARASSPYQYAPGQQASVPSSDSNHPGYQYSVPATTNMQYPQGQALPLSGGYPYAFPQGPSQAPG